MTDELTLAIREIVSSHFVFEVDELNSLNEVAQEIMDKVNEHSKMKQVGWYAKVLDEEAKIEYFLSLKYISSDEEIGRIVVPVYIASEST